MLEIIGSGSGFYEGTNSDVKLSFPLKSNGLPVFERFFDASNDVGIGSDSSQIFLSNHFFVSGEDLEYSFDESSSPIGIVTENIPGIGITDKLPKKVYAIKVNNSTLRLASTIENSLKFIPEFLEFSELGIGTQHKLTSKNQLGKSLIAIDNVIQSPIVSSPTSSILLSDVTSFDSILQISNTDVFKSGDFIKINQEIIKINSIGFGSPSAVFVERGVLGTEESHHYSEDIVFKVQGNYNILNNTLTFSSPPFGGIPQEVGPPNDVDYSGIKTSSTFNGRLFLRSGVINSNQETYSNNYIFDDISDNFINLSGEYELTVDGQSIDDNLVNTPIVLTRSIFQSPERDTIIKVDVNYKLIQENNTTSISFIGDVSSSNFPIGGVISSVGSTSGIGYQPLVSAGATAIISAAGTIESISIGNSGSGYRPGIHPIINVGVVDGDNIINIGKAEVENGNIVNIIIETPGIGYTFTNPPEIAIDPPIGYFNLPLKYSNTSNIGIGTGATIDLVVSLSGKIIDFNITNNGYGYNIGDILTVDVGGNVGIPTTPDSIFEEFQIFVDNIFNDDFSAWSFGELEILDPIDKFFNGRRKTFPIKKDGILRSIRSKKGLDINVEPTLLVFINNVLQKPGESYIFNGGSVITFNEAPKGEDPDNPGSGDKSKILFYRGTPGIDVIDVDILETIQIGDKVNIKSDNIFLSQNQRSVHEILSTDSIETNSYPGPGIFEENSLLRPITWCKSRNDKVIDGKAATKDRIWYEPLINPVTNIIQNVGLGTTISIYVEGVKTFFDSKNEFISGDLLSTIEIISLEESKKEIIKNVSYFGDFGIVTGVSTTIIGINTLGIVFDFYIPENSYLRDSNIVDIPIEKTQISPGDYFVIKKSNIGNGIVSINEDQSIVSIGNSFIDNIYKAISVEDFDNIIRNSIVIFDDREFGSPLIIDNSVTVTIEDTGTLTVNDFTLVKVTTVVQSYNGLDFDEMNYDGNYFGEYSWGKINTTERINPKQFNKFDDTLSGINSSPVVRRLNPLRFLNYIS